MKPLLTFLFAFSCFLLGAQVKFKVTLNPSSNTYQVSLKPDVSWLPPLNTTSSAQVTLRVPSGGFTPGTVTNLAGIWSHSTVVSPPENPGFDYIVFGLQGVTAAISYQKDVEVALFSFENVGACTGVLELIKNNEDPFWPPNSQSVNVGNQISVIGAGIGVNAYKGNYGSQPADCLASSGNCIEVHEVILNSPSGCNMADGSIEVVAVGNPGLPPLQYSINNGFSWQLSPVFNNLTAGDVFEVVVQDLAAICIVEVGDFELQGPLAAIVTGSTLLHPDCGESNGSIAIEAYSENGGALQFSMSELGPWQSSPVFQGLATGTYTLYIYNQTSNCTSPAGTYTLTECTQQSCLLTYELEKLPDESFQVSLLSDTTWNFPFNITSSMQITVKVPAGGFVASNLTSLLTGVTFNQASVYAAPAEDPGHDYISFILGSPGTQGIPYKKGEKTPLFTFKNSGTCQGGQVVLMDNAADPFYPPNSQNANVGQQLTVSGYASADAPVCISNLPASDCTGDPCAALAPGFTTENACAGSTLHFLNTTTSIGSVTSWNWDFGDGSAPSDSQSPSHVFSIPGDFEVSLTVTTEGGCHATFSKVVTVFPLPSEIPANSYVLCSGDSVQLHSTAHATASWTPLIGLSNASIPNPLAFPASTTVYTLTLTNDFGCVRTEEVTVEVADKPLLDSTTTQDLSGCSLHDGSILIHATGTGDLLFSIDGGASFQPGSQFQGLAAGTYQVAVANADSTCLVALPEPVVLHGQQAPEVLTPVADFSLCEGSDILVAIQTDQDIASFDILTTGTYEGDTVVGGTLSFVVAAATLGSHNYSVELTTVQGCTVMEEFVQTTIALPEASFAAPSSSCTNGEVEINFNGIAGSQAILEWSLSGGAIVSASSQSPTAPDSASIIATWADTGTKTIVLTINDQGCVASGTGVINITTFEPGIELTVTNASCGESNGAIQLSLSGSGFYSYLWSNGLTSANLSALSQGSYQVTVTELSTSCSTTASAVVDMLPGLSIGSLTESPATDCSGSAADGSLHIEIIGGTGELTYTLYQIGNLAEPLDQIITTQTAVSFSGLGVGAYQLEVVDANGCSAAATSSVTSGGGVMSASINTTPVTCNQNNGSFSIVLHGGQKPYQYDLYKNNSLLAGGVQMPDSSLLVDNLAAAAYVLIFTDANGCLLPVVMTIKKSEILVNSTTTLASGCGKADGSVCILAYGGSGPYTLSSSQGLAPSGTFDSTACVTDLGEGIVQMVITDVNGCEKPLSFNLGQFVVPEITADSLLLTNSTCPGSFGTIASKTNHQYQIFDSNNSLVGLTPWNAAPAGTYKVIYSLGNCTAETFVTILGVPDWQVSYTSLPASCAGNDGSISLSVGGANGEYTYLWSNGDSMPTADSLSASTTCSVTITDASGCSTTLSDLVVGLDCVLPCDEIFYLDTFNVILQPGLTEICLPTEELVISNFGLTLNGTAYTGPINGCVESAYFYDYGMLLNLGEPPYYLDEWTVNGRVVSDFQFDELSQLVELMNLVDALGNWALDALGNSIIGGVAGVNYPSLNITHLASNTTLTLPLATVSVAHPSIFVADTPLTHIFIATDPVQGCADTLYINLIEDDQPGLPRTDTIFVQVPVGETLPALCIPTDELQGTLVSMVNSCEVAAGPAQINALDGWCLEIIGVEAGTMQACIVICDDLGVCDTTLVLIEALETSRDLVIFNGFSPNEDGYNDFFKIKNIEFYPENELAIFNRWGNQVYHANSYSNTAPWRGQHGNSILPDGTYFYILEVKIDGQKKKLSGYVELRR